MRILGAAVVKPTDSNPDATKKSKKVLVLVGSLDYFAYIISVIKN